MLMYCHVLKLHNKTLTVEDRTPLICLFLFLFAKDSTYTVG